jgi:hypothetical protein
MSGLALGSQGLKWRSASAATAVRVIAANTSASAPLGPNAIDDVLSAVLALMAQRSSRGPLGPLGPLESVAPPKAPMASSPKAGPGTDSRGAGVRSV